MKDYNKPFVGDGDLLLLYNDKLSLSLSSVSSRLLNPVRYALVIVFYFSRPALVPVIYFSYEFVGERTPLLRVLLGETV